MAKKKILFVISNPSQFKGFFRNKLDFICKEFDVYLLVYPYGFQRNSELKIEIKQWINKLRKKSIVKGIWYLKSYSYYNINSNIKFNLEFLKTIREIITKKIDIFFVPSLSHYWEKIIVKFFKQKKIYGYLCSPPSGLDLFNSLKDFNKSIENKKLIFEKGSFYVSSDDKYLHKINTNSPVSENKIPIISFLLEKTIIRINLFINLFIVPMYLNFFIIRFNNFFDKVNFNFLGVNKIICFHPIVFSLLKKTYPEKKIYCCDLNKNKEDNSKLNKNWIFLCNDTYYKSIDIFFKILIKLKKLKKISKIHIKKHPSWQSKDFDTNFQKKLRETKVPYKILKKTENVKYENYVGIISEPSSVYIESLTHNKKIKVIGIAKNRQTSSGAVIKFYKKINNICWEPNFFKLKKYLSKKTSFEYKNLVKFSKVDLNL